MDIHREGVVWSSLARGHLASFDRRRLERLIGNALADGRFGPARQNAGLSGGRPVITTLRSAPRGRAGVAAGSSPAAMRSVQ
jgi:hypothetical protein